MIEATNIAQGADSATAIVDLCTFILVLATSIDSRGRGL